MGRPMRSARPVSLCACTGQPRSVLTYASPLLESPRAGGVGQPPLHQLPAAQSGPHAFPRRLCRAVGHLPVAAIA